MEDNFGRRLKKGNYNGKISFGRYKGLDYRDSRVAGTWNLYKNNKFVKHVGLELWDGIRKESQ